MLSPVRPDMRAAVVPIIRAPMTSAMRTDMRSAVPIMVVADGRSVMIVVVFIVVSLRQTGGADDQG
jgi:hypothetical protein